MRTETDPVRFVRRAYRTETQLKLKTDAPARLDKEVYLERAGDRRPRRGVFPVRGGREGAEGCQLQGVRGRARRDGVGGSAAGPVPRGNPSGHPAGRLRQAGGRQGAGARRRAGALPGAHQLGRRRARRARRRGVPGVAAQELARARADTARRRARLRRARPRRSKPGSCPCRSRRSRGVRRARSCGSASPICARRRSARWWRRCRRAPPEATCCGCCEAHRAPIQRRRSSGRLRADEPTPEGGRARRVAPRSARLGGPRRTSVAICSRPASQPLLSGPLSLSVSPASIVDSAR